MADPVTSNAPSKPYLPSLPPQRLPSPPPIVTTRLPKTEPEPYASFQQLSSTSPSSPGIGDLTQWYVRFLHEHLIPILRECARTLYSSPSSSSSPVVVPTLGKVSTDETTPTVSAPPNPNTSSYHLMFMRSFLSFWNQSLSAEFEGEKKSSEVVICRFLESLTEFVHGAVLPQIESDSKRLKTEKMKLGESMEKGLERVQCISGLIEDLKQRIHSGEAEVARLLDEMGQKREEGVRGEAAELDLLRGRSDVLSARIDLRGKEGENISLHDRIVQQKEGLRNLQDAIDSREQLAARLGEILQVFEEVSEVEPAAKETTRRDSEESFLLAKRNEQILSVLGCWNLVEMKGLQTFFFSQFNEVTKEIEQWWGLPGEEGIESTRED